MKKITLILCALTLPLGGCATFALPGSPAALAQQTRVDEQIIITAEQGYKAFRLAVEVGVNAKIIHGPRAAELAQFDDKLYAGLLGMEAAYAAGNAASFAVAQSTFNQYLVQANVLAGSK